MADGGADDEGEFDGGECDIPVVNEGRGDVGGREDGEAVCDG